MQHPNHWALNPSGWVGNSLGPTLGDGGTAFPLPLALASRCLFQPTMRGSASEMPAETSTDAISS